MGQVIIKLCHYLFGLVITGDTSAEGTRDADMNSSRWIELIRKSGVVSEDALSPWADRCKETVDACSIASMMVDAQLLTAWQAKLLLMGKWKGFIVDQYCLLDDIESDNARGTKTCGAMDRDTGSRVILEIAHPSRARTKDGRLFYEVRRDS